MCRNIHVNRKKLRSELAKAQDALERYPDGWIGHEAMGRVLRWIQDPSAEYHLRQVVNHLERQASGVGRPIATQQIRLGNLYRLLGDNQQAAIHLEQGFELAKESTGAHSDLKSLNYHTMQYLIVAGFMLKEDEDTVPYGRLYRQRYSDDKLNAYQLSGLAEARLTKNLLMAQEIVERISEIMHRGRVQIRTTGGYVSQWDVYELAMDTLDEMEKGNSAENVSTA